MRSSENTEQAPTRQRELGTGPTALECPLDVPDRLNLPLARGAAALAGGLALCVCFGTARRKDSPTCTGRLQARPGKKGQLEAPLHRANVPLNSEQRKDKHMLVKEKRPRIKKSLRPYGQQLTLCSLSSPWKKNDSFKHFLFRAEETKEELPHWREGLEKAQS